MLLNTTMAYYFFFDYIDRHVHYFIFQVIGDNLIFEAMDASIELIASVI